MRHQGGSDEDGRLDEVTIRAFLDGPYPRLVAGMALVCRDRAAAEDAVQEALARAWHRSARGQEIRSLEAWVTTVALNLLRSRVRRLMAELRARGRLPAPTAAPEPGGDAVDLERAMATLPRRQREVTVLRYYLGLTVTEIAEVLKVTDGTVKTSLHRARAALAKALQEERAPGEVGTDGGLRGPAAN